MVVALGPGKFYGSSLPRPRFYSDVKFSDTRIDPPIPVTDPFMSWAEEAHWSMGGLSFKRHRLQGRIEGNVNKLRKERESFIKKKVVDSVVPVRSKKKLSKFVDSVKVRSKKDRGSSSPSSPPPAPVANKRRRYLGLVDESESESEDEDEDEEREVVRKMPVRKLTEDFDRVAEESGMRKKKRGGTISPVKSSGSGSEGVGLRTRSRRSEQVEEKGGLKGKKSPRLVKKWAK